MVKSNESQSVLFEGEGSNFVSLGRQFELLSGFQKFIRRGMEIEALRAFYAIAESGKQGATMAINRIKVIAHEDIGLADMTAVMFAVQSADYALSVYGKQGWRIAAANAILALSRAVKSRLSGHAMAVARGRNLDSELELPDWVYDQHTRKGKQLGRGLDHFRKEGALLDRVDNEKTPDPYEDEAYQNFRRLK